jgi:cytochrome b subunit of formate dehydrogenase/mono/diheme cytochrome c family protein
MAKKSTSPQTDRTYERFPLARRIEHLAMLLSFTTLGLTGLVQKFATSPISQFLVGVMGGIENTRSIHHFAAIVLMIGTMWHIVVFGYNFFVLRTSLSMLPGPKDAIDALQAFLYNVGLGKFIGLGKTRPQMGRYTFEEKAEYWAFVWGTAVMGVTGFLMWNPITAAKFLPGEIIPAAKAAHGGEAVLAVLAIILWHMYGVHIKFFNKAMWTGKMTEEQMQHEHPLELESIKAGTADRRPDEATIRKRQKIYFPIASVLTLVMLAGIYGFINTETTALTTIPPQAGEQVEIYVPRTATARPTSTPTTVPTAAPTKVANTPSAATTPDAASTVVSWDGSVGPLLNQKCSACHGTSGGLNLSTYADAMKGGKSGIVFTAGDSANSLMIVKFESGKHPYAVLTAEELAQIKAWLDAGALEK